MYRPSLYIYPVSTDENVRYEGTVNNTRATLEEAGIAASDITLLGDAETTQAALGSFDVMVVPDTHCSDGMNDWRPVLMEHLRRGGRWVVLGGNGLFILRRERRAASRGVPNGQVSGLAQSKLLRSRRFDAMVIFPDVLCPSDLRARLRSETRVARSLNRCLQRASLHRSSRNRPFDGLVLLFPPKI